jgi:GGDEF domain-containing protein
MSAAAGAAVAAAIANAIKASGVVVRVRPEDFANILRRVDKPLVIYSKGGLFATKHHYLISYKGFAFYTKTSEQIDLPRSIEVIIAEKIWIPS